MTLSFQQGDSKWREYRHKALNDLYWFCSFVLGYSDFEGFDFGPETHLLPLRFAERKTGIPEIDTAPYQLILWPRETGKSSCVTVGRSLQMGCRDPNTAITIVNEKLELASEFLDSIKMHVETNQMLRALFPEIIPHDTNKVAWSQTKASLQRDTKRPQSTFQALGVGAALAGKHPDHIVCDDLISDEAMENARSGNWSVMERVKRWVNHLEPVLSSTAKPFPTMTFIGTVWWHSDVYAHVEETLGRGSHRKFRVSVQIPGGRRVSHDVERKGKLAIMRIAVKQDGRLMFPSIWPEERIAHVMETDPEFGSCNLFNDPANPSVRQFQDSWLHYWRYTDTDGRILIYKNEEERNEFLDIRSLYKVITVDPAAVNQENPGARNAIVVVGVDQESGKFFLLDVVANRDDPEDLVDEVVNTAQRWGVHTVHIELAGQQKYVIQWVQREARQRQYPLVVEDLKPGGRNKDLRIGGLVVPFKNGDLYIHASFDALLEEYRKYRPGSPHRDVLDALAYAIETAPKPIRGQGSSAQERSRRQLESYHARLLAARRH